MKHLLSGAALAALMTVGAPIWARSPANPAAGAAILPPADPASAKPAATTPVEPAAADTAAAVKPVAITPAAVTATAIRHDRAAHRRYVWHRRQARRHHWRHGGRSDRVAEALNLEELHRPR